MISQIDQFKRPPSQRYKKFYLQINLQKNYLNFSEIFNLIFQIATNSDFVVKCAKYADWFSSFCFSLSFFFA